MKAYMVCLELKPKAAGWKAQTNPLSYELITNFRRYQIEPSCAER